MHQHVMRDGRRAHGRVDEPQPPRTGPAEAAPVCLRKPFTNESCGQVWFEGKETFDAYAMPRGMRHFVIGDERPRQLNDELGRSHARLPVTHTHTMQHPWQPGLWFYYVGFPKSNSLAIYR
jgi:hypothetical protein